MAESSRDTKSTKPEADKKQPETVQLTAEELRAIAGGATPGGSPPISSGDLRPSPFGPQKS